MANRAVAATKKRKVGSKVASKKMLKNKALPHTPPPPGAELNPAKAAGKKAPMPLAKSAPPNVQKTPRKMAFKKKKTAKKK
jgi:hypothetical protein